jgi:hypothetical protein
LYKGTIMTLYQFNLLEKHEQAETIFSKGVFLAERTNKQFGVLLYQIDGFYVEVIIPRDHQKPGRFRSFRSTDQLTPYLNSIEISFLDMF